MSGRFKWERSIRDSDLPPNTRFVMLAMATYMDRDGFARPAQQTLADATGLSVRAVRRNIQSAIEAGWLAKLSQGRNVGRNKGGGTGMASEYQATIPVAGGQQRPAANDSQAGDNSSQEDSSGPLPSWQEDAESWQEDVGDLATGHQWPPSSMNTSIPPERCGDCDGHGWVSTTYHAGGIGKEAQGVVRCSCATRKARTA